MIAQKSQILRFVASGLAILLGTVIISPVWGADGFRDVSVSWQDNMSGQTFGAHTSGQSIRAVASAPTIDRCLMNAARFYNVDPNIVRAIRRVEGGTVGHESANTNQTVDMGPMQINTIWLDAPGLKGISRADLKNNACLNVWVGTWILAKNIARTPNDLWRGVANYHSRTPKYHRTYKRKVKRAYRKIITAQRKAAL